MNNAHDSKGSGTIPSLDGIRAIAVSLVFIAHSGLEHFVPGGLGVTIFFVLSGYLITTLARVEFSRTGRIHLRAFYLRRVLRLMPPLFIVAGLAGLAAAAGWIDGGFTLGGLLSVLFYLGNYYVIDTDFSGIPHGIGVVWSLAVEEHYYLLYPPLALLLMRLRAHAVAVWVLLALCMVVLLWRQLLYLNGASEAWLTMASDARVDAILAGCVLAFWRNPWLSPSSSTHPVRETALLVVAVGVLLISLLYRDESFRLVWRYTVQSIAIAALLWLAVARSERWPFRWLNTRPMVWIGTVSYTIYLSHQVFLFAVQKHLPELHGLAVSALAAVVTLLFAEGMRRLVERPCGRLRQRLHHEYLNRDQRQAPAAAPTGATARAAPFAAPAAERATPL